MDEGGDVLWGWVHVGDVDALEAWAPEWEVVPEFFVEGECAEGECGDLVAAGRKCCCVVGDWIVCFVVVVRAADVHVRVVVVAEVCWEGGEFVGVGVADVHLNVWFFLVVVVGLGLWKGEVADVRHGGSLGGRWRWSGVV